MAIAANVNVPTTWLATWPRCEACEPSKSNRAPFYMYYLRCMMSWHREHAMQHLHSVFAEASDACAPCGYDRSACDRPADTRARKKTDKSHVFPRRVALQPFICSSAAFLPYGYSCMHALERSWPLSRARKGLPSTACHLPSGPLQLPIS